jgi:hypothetical protein
MRYFGFSNKAGVVLEINIITTPVMRQIGPNQQHVAACKTAYVIADELRAVSINDMKKFNIGMVMPFVKEKWQGIMPHAK